MPEAVIVSTARSPIGRAGKGSLKDLRPDDLTATIIQAALAKVPELDPKDIDDLMLNPEGSPTSTTSKTESSQSRTRFTHCSENRVASPGERNRWPMHKATRCVILQSDQEYRTSVTLS